MRQITRRIWLAVVALSATTAPAWADITVHAVDGVPVVEVRAAELAVFQPRDHELWVVAPAGQALVLPGALTDAGHVSAAWRAETLKVPGGQGLRLLGAMTHRWQINGSAGHWQLQLLVDGQTGSALMPVTPTNAQPLTATARDGTQHQVILAPGPVAGLNMPAVLAGAVVDTAAVAETSVALQKIMPAEGPSLPVVAEQAAGNLAAVGDPALDRQELAPKALQVYQPGAVMPFSAPEGWSWRGHELVPTSELQRGLQGAVTQGAVAEAEAAVSASVAAPVAVAKPQLHGDKISVTGLTFAAPLLPSVVTWPVEGGKVSATTFPQRRAAADDAVQQALLACRKLPGSVLPTATAIKGAAAAVEPAEGGDAKKDSAAKGDEAAAKQPEEGGKKADKDKGPNPSAPGQAALGWTWGDFTSCEHDPAVVQARRDLATLELAAGHAPEALTVLALLPGEAVSTSNPAELDHLPLDGASRWLTAVALTERGNGAAAEKILAGTAWPAVWQPQVNLWLAAAQQAQNRSGAALNSWPRERGLLTDYPAPLRLALQRAIATAQVAVGDPHAAQTFVDELAQDFSASGGEVTAAKDSSPSVAGPEDGSWTSAVPPWLVRLQGKVRLGGSAEDEGLEMLAKASRQTRDPVTAAQAKYDFVHALLRRGELSRPQAIAYLDELRLFWRGDDLEKKLLGELGDLNLADGDYRAALGNWQTLVRLSPDDPDMSAITDKMTNTLLAAFDPDTGANYSPLIFAGLYYDFKTLLPADARGDRATERVADLMAEIGLFDRSLPLYRQLLQFSKIAPVDQARIALKLAAGMRETGDAGNALQLLDKYHPIAINSLQKEEWKMEEARCLMALQHYDSATKALAGSDGPAVKALRGEIAWKQQDWAAVRNLLQPVLAPTTTADSDEASATVPVAALRLAYAEMMADKDGATAAPAVSKVVERFRPALESDPLAGDVVSAIAGEAGVSGTLPTAPGRPLGQVAVTLRDMNALAAAATTKRTEEVKARDDRQEYDSRMRYMDLLPPPAI